MSETGAGATGAVVGTGGWTGILPSGTGIGTMGYGIGASNGGIVKLKL